MINKILIGVILTLSLAVAFQFTIISNQKEKNKSLKIDVGYLKAINEIEKESNEKAKQIRREYLSEINSKNEKINSLLSDVSSNNKRLLIKSTCSTLSATENTCGAGAGTAELDENARRAYFDLRAGIIKINAQLSMCKKTLKGIN